MPMFFSPYAILDRCEPRVKFFDAKEMMLTDDDDHVDWCVLNDLVMDEYEEWCSGNMVHYGLLEVDRPQREGRGLYLASFNTDLWFNAAAPAARAGLYWNTETQAPCLAESIRAYRSEINRHRMADTTRGMIHDAVEQWRVMFPDDQRVTDFATDFVLDMIVRNRVYDTDMYGRKQLYFDRAI